MSPERIDVHHHVLTPEYVEELAKVGVVEAGSVPLAQLQRWKPEESLAVMDRYGIGTALLSVSSPGLSYGDAAKAREMARSLNEFAAEIQSDSAVTAIKVAAGGVPAVVIRAAISIMAAYPITKDRFRHILREIAERRATRGFDETPPRDDNAG